MSTLTNDSPMPPSTSAASSTNPLDDDLSNPKHPFNKSWRGSKDGTVRLDGIPKFDDPYAEREWIKEHMAAVFRFWGKMGYGSDGLVGNITVRDPVLAGHYWINPLPVHYLSMTKSELVLVDSEGYVTSDGAQLPINLIGFLVNSTILKARPDVNVVAHCHSTHGKAWSVFGRLLEITTQEACALYHNHVVYDPDGVMYATKQGEGIARVLGPKNQMCILQNHGLLALGKTVDEAGYLIAILDKQCQVQLLVEGASTNSDIQRVLIGKEEAEFNTKFLQDPHILYANFQPEYNLVIEETNGACMK